MTRSTEPTFSKALLLAAPLVCAPLFLACSSETTPDPGAGGTGGGGNPKGGMPGVAGKAAGAAGVGGSAGTGAAGGGAGAGAGGTGGAIAGGSGTSGAMSSGGKSGSGGLPPGGSSGAGGMGGMGGAAGLAGNGGMSGASAGIGGATGGAGASGGQAGSAGASAGAGGSGGSGEVGRSAGCGKARTLMNGRKTISSGGNREFILRVPDNYDNNKAYRFILAYHWLNGNANQVAEGGNGGSTDDPYYGLWDLADNSTIFVAPEGLNAGWSNSGGADVKLTDAIIAQIESELCIDTTRIFATGFSFGAGMSYALACARADVFRGVVLYAGGQLSGCDGGTKPIAYMHVHGVSDSVLNISGGRQMRDHYVMVNGCTAQNITDVGANSGTHACTSYQGCSEGHPTRWCSHGGDHNPTEKDSGQNKSWVPGEAWNFIKQF